MSVRRQLAWISLSQASFFVLQFFGTVVVSRILVPADVGIYTVALAISSVLGIIQAFGLNGFIVREEILDETTERSVFTVNAILAIALSAAIYSLSFIGGDILHERGVRDVMALLSIGPLLGIFELLPSAKLERNGEFRTIAVIGALRVLVSQAVTVALVVYGARYIGLAYGQLAASVFSLIAFNIAGRHHVVFRPGLEHWRKITSFGVQVMVVGGINAISARITDFLLAKVVGLPALGLYSRASNLNNLAWENVHLVIGRVLFVDFSSRSRSGTSLRTTYLKTIETLTALMWPLFAGISIVSGPFIMAVYGERWVRAAHPLAMLGITAMLQTAISMTWELFVINKATGKQAKIEAIRACASVILFLFGCLFGLTGAAASRIADALLAIYLYRPFLSRFTQTQTRDFVGIYARSLLLTVVAVGPSAVLMWSHHASAATPLALVASTAALGVLLWGMSLVALKHPLYYEIARLAAKVRLTLVRPAPQG